MASKLPIGVNLPVRLGEQGYFDQTFDTLTQAKTGIEILLRTRKGERVMQPHFGSDLYKYIFESDIDTSLVEALIREEVKFWLPNISINTIEVDRGTDNIDNYIIYIKITFSVNGNKTLTDTLELTL